jgi:hypothetical protein
VCASFGEAPRENRGAKQKKGSETSEQNPPQDMIMIQLIFMMAAD